jgi:hypothetical protein
LWSCSFFFGREFYSRDINVKIESENIYCLVLRTNGEMGYKKVGLIFLRDSEKRIHIVGKSYLIKYILGHENGGN